MKKIAKILSAVIAVVMALSMITFAFAADKAAVSLNLVSEDANSVTVSVALDEGNAIGALEVVVSAKSGNIGALTEIKVNKAAFDMNATNKDNGMVAVAAADGFSAGTAVAEYTFAKTASDNVSVEDFAIAVNNCANVDLDAVDCAAVNKLPAKVVAPDAPADQPEADKPEADKPEADKPEADKPEADKPEADKPEADKPEADKPEADKPEADKPEADQPEADKPEADKPEADQPEADKPEADKPEADQPEADKPEADQPEADKPEADKPEADKPEADQPEADKPEADQPEADKPEADKPEADAPVADDKTDAPAADDKTDAPATGDVVNPDTGDSATATAAILSLLAVSGAALVALRKKED